MIIGRATCLSLFGPLQQNMTDWEAYRQQKCISHISGVWEVQDLGTSIVVFWVRALFLVHSQHLISVSSHGEWG